MRVIDPRCALVGAAVALAACRETSGPGQAQQYNYAIFDADIAPVAPGVLSARPAGFFFRAPARNLPSSEGGQDVCVLQRLGASNNNYPPFISAGDSIAFSAEGGSTIYLKPEVSDTGVTSYVVPNGSLVPVTAGATVTFDVPGAANGFPASSIALKTAEPYQIADIPADIPAGQALTLTWSPGVTPGSRMDVAFMYATATGAGFNEQLYCSLLDDGDYIVPSSLLFGWRGAANNVRQFVSRRWRTSFKDLGGSVMLAISTYSAPPQATQ